ncbi:MAG: RagB/SusD family nutrient uptake outer membrane protein [Mangrovibacterium sp.]
MKWINKIIGIPVVIGLMMTSCQDFNDLLEKEDTGDLDLEAVFSDIRNAEKILTDVYVRLPDYLLNNQNNNGKMVQSCMAEAYSVYGSTTLAFAHAFWYHTGDFSPSAHYYSTNATRANDFGDFYRFDYAAIRAALLFLENIDKVPYDDEYGYGPDEKNVKINEAKFLLAFFYMDLLKNYGGVTIVDHVLITTDPELKAERNTYDECVEYIVKLCDEAASGLPLSWPSSQIGRATKGAAMALKAQALLFSASPLFNDPAKPTDSPFRGKYDQDKWKLAAQAAADVIQLNQYRLVNDITKLFTTFTNEEIIFARITAPGYHWERSTLPSYIGWRATNAGRNQLTYNMMQYYKIIKGGKAYDQNNPEGGFDLQNPFVNLDPRFYRDVAYTGANLRQNRIVQMWELGENTSTADRAANLGQINTYLCNIKMCDLNIDPLRSDAGGLAHHNFPFFRYADVLLMYAEAMNEAYGPDVDALSIGLTATQAVNMIRARTKCMPYPEFKGYTYSMPLMETGLSKENFRKEVRQERIVEMNFEDAVFYDIRRWKFSVESQRTAYVLQPILYREAPGGQTKLRYQLIGQPRAFESSWYILPIPQPEIQKNPNLVQNPGWSGSPEADNN